MKIVIDARMYGLEHAGIGRYVVNLVREIKNLKFKIKNLEIALLVRFKNLEEIKREVGDAFKIVLCDAPHYSFKEQIFLPIQLIKLKPDLVHFPHFNVPIFWWGKYIVTIHDLIKHESRGMGTTTCWPLFYWFKYLNYRVLVWLAVKKATRIITPSQWWKNELIKRYHLPPEKIVVTYEGAGGQFQTSDFRFQTSNKILEKYKIKKPFVIYTGSLYPHKNIETLVEAVRQFNKQSLLLRNKLNKLHLIIVCSRNVFYERFKQKLKSIKVQKFVNLIGFVPDEELVAIYREAEAFVFPSLIEGFGLPGLEAMAVGLPVLASEIPVFREVYQDAALYFEPTCINELIHRIKEIISNKKLKESLKVKGFNLVRNYSWEKMAKETLRVYNIF